MSKRLHAHRTAARIVVGVLILVFMAGPFFWIALVSVQNPTALYSTSLLKTNAFTTSNYSGALQSLDIVRDLLNTLAVSVSSAILAVGLGVLGGYALARYKLVGDRWLLLTIVATQMFPGLLLTVPLYQILSSIGLINTLPGLALVYTSSSLPFAIWMMRNYFRGLPRELGEAALVDGCSMLGSLRRIILPVSFPAMIACSVFCIIVAWDDFLYASTFLISSNNWTISVGLYSLIGQYVSNWGVVMAGTVMATLPIVLAFLAVQGRITSLLGGSVKG